jgi:tRNA pseudouridine32 synthase/23S rRNA pseudouridine746 synthase
MEIMLHSFINDISNIELPRLFTWPFHYVPHPLACMAAEQVQAYIAEREEWRDEIARGKMFGVLVVEDRGGELGFLAAFSGNLDGKNHHDYFVPPIYDMLQPDDFFRREEAEISAINCRIAELLRSPDYNEEKGTLERVKQEAEHELATFKEYLKERKTERDRRRAAGDNDEVLIRDSQRDNADMQRLKRVLRERVAEQQQRFDMLHVHIEALKGERQQRSAQLQMQLFEQFRIMNARGEVRDLCELFAPTSQGTPPAGAGECAAPKLLQYAYLNKLRPIAMAEFWQGASPRGEVRHHGAYYPACNGKCKPILTHMLKGLDVEPNPLTAIKPAEPTIEDMFIKLMKQ